MARKRPPLYPNHVRTAARAAAIASATPRFFKNPPCASITLDHRNKSEGATLPEETFLNSVVKANIRLPEERLIESVTLRLTHRRPELGCPELASDNQQVLEKIRNHVTLPGRSRWIIGALSRF